MILSHHFLLGNKPAELKCCCLEESPRVLEMLVATHSPKGDVGTNSCNMGISSCMIWLVSNVDLLLSCH